MARTNRLGRYVVGFFDWIDGNLSITMIPNYGVGNVDGTHRLWEARKWNSRQAARKWLLDSNTPRCPKDCQWEVLNLDQLNAPL